MSDVRPKARRITCVLAALALWPAAERSAAHAQAEVDLQLVLAVDASGSIDAHEFALQMDGIAAAFRDQAVVTAIESGPIGRIAVTVALWAEPGGPKDALPWSLIHDAASAAAFADVVERAPRSIPGGGTGIGEGVLYAIRLLEGSGLVSTRRVIDLSGDGRETTFRDFNFPAGLARFAATARGIVINGLAILADEPDLDAYYRRTVVAGPGAFVMTARSFDDFADAMRRKLIKEIEYRPEVSEARPRRATPARVLPSRDRATVGAPPHGEARRTAHLR